MDRAVPRAGEEPIKQLEVEAKYRVDDFGAVRAALRELGAAEVTSEHEHDTYLAHPVRDFAKTDEAFRIRSVGPGHCLTYKGPRTDGPMKSREEIEIPIGTSAEDRPRILKMVKALGFEPVADVEKRRTSFQLKEREQTVTITLDEVAGIRPHVEVEVVSTNRAEAESLVDAVAERLRLSAENIETRSYLELVLDSR